MIDPFVILAPVLLFAVTALLRFIGCTAFGTASEPAPVPTITSISPESVTAGGPTFTLTVNGTGFVNEAVQSVVQWNGVDKHTTFFSDTQLTATILASDIATAGKASVTVFTPPSGTPPSGGGTSAPALTFTIVAIPNVTVTFDSPPPPTIPPNNPLKAPYKGLDFGVDQWFWQGPTGLEGANSVSFNTGSASLASRQFSFAGGAKRVLLRIKVYVQIDGNFTLTDDAGQTFNSGLIQATDPPKFYDTGWTIPSGAVTVTSSVGWDLLIDAIVYKGPPV